MWDRSSGGRPDRVLLIVDYWGDSCLSGRGGNAGRIVGSRRWGVGEGGHPRVRGDLTHAVGGERRLGGQWRKNRLHEEKRRGGVSHCSLAARPLP